MFDSMLKTVVSTFGREFEYLPAKSEPIKMVGVLTCPYQRVDLGEVGLSSQHYEITVERAVLPLNVNMESGLNDWVLFDGTYYEVSDIKPDGQVGAKLVLLKLL